MFDYDSRPVTPQVVLVGRRASSLGYELRDFLSRNGVPYDWVESRRCGSRPTAARRRRCRSEPTSDLCAARRSPARRRNGGTSRERTRHGGRAAVAGIRHHDRRRRSRGTRGRGVRRLRGTAHGCDRSGRARRTGGHDVDDRELSRLSARHQRERVGHTCHRAGAPLRRRTAPGSTARRHPARRRWISGSALGRDGGSHPIRPRRERRRLASPRRRGPRRASRRGRLLRRGTE